MNFPRKTINSQFFLSFVFVSLLSLVSSFFFQWYSIVFVAMVVTAVFKQKPFKAFLSSFLALFALWFGLSFYLTIINNNILQTMISKMLFGIYIPYLLNMVSGLIGGLVGGLGSLVSSHLIAIIKTTQIGTVEIHRDKKIIEHEKKVSLNEKEDYLKTESNLRISTSPKLTSRIVNKNFIDNENIDHNSKVNSAKIFTKKEDIKDVNKKNSQTKTNKIKPTKISKNKTIHSKLPKNSDSFAMPSIEDQIKKNKDLQKI